MRNIANSVTNTLNIELLFSQLVSTGHMTLDIASNFLCNVIYGLQVHGQHEGPLALLLGLITQMYELLVSHDLMRCELLVSQDLMRYELLESHDLMRCELLVSHDLMRYGLLVSHDLMRCELLVSHDSIRYKLLVSHD